MSVEIPDQLLNGYRVFRGGRLKTEQERYRVLADGQSPKVMIIGCADSRVDPATIFSAHPGELFVVRNVAALVPPYEEGGTYHGTSAALEFAVDHLLVDHIVVMGHGMCGGCAAALTAVKDRPVGQFIGPWVGQLEGLADTILEQLSDEEPDVHQRAMEHGSVRQSVEHLREFNFVTEAEEKRGLRLHGAWFSIGDAELQWLDQETGSFEPVREIVEAA
ncbi:MAG: carbonic anhydrase [Pseudomonadota bacterium]